MSDDIEGAAQLRTALLAAPERAVPILAAALWQEANGIMTDAKAQTPVKTGVLRASGTVYTPEIQRPVITVTLGFGGAARAYALIQHERTDFHHTVGKDHYLSDPMQQHIPGMEGRLAAIIAAQNLFPGLP